MKRDVRWLVLRLPCLFIFCQIYIILGVFLVRLNFILYLIFLQKLLFQEKGRVLRVLMLFWRQSFCTFSLISAQQQVQKVCKWEKPHIENVIFKIDLTCVHNRNNILCFNFAYMSCLKLNFISLEISTAIVIFFKLGPKHLDIFSIFSVKICATLNLWD